MSYRNEETSYRPSPNLPCRTKVLHKAQYYQLLDLVPIGRVLGVCRPPVCPDVGPEAPRFLILLAALMAVTAQGLQRTQPELIPVATVRLDVVGDHRRHHMALVQTMLAQGVHLHLHPGAGLPSAKAVPVARVGRMQHQAPRSVKRFNGCGNDRKFGCGCEGQAPPDSQPVAGDKADKGRER